MIGSLRGKVIELHTDSAVIECAGVGYEIHGSSNTLADLQTKVGKEVSVSIHTHVREDAFTLFAFTDKNEKQLFLSLLKVNGIGPKMAVNILSGSTTSHIASMIESEDVKGLTGLPKVGKKIAEQMILSLKGKLVKTETLKASGKTAAKSEISSALVNLGFRPVDVDKVVKDLPANVEIQEGIRQSLAALTSL